ncbi:hypothetical protein Afil01_24690 [Actinorhabdospora filicis]|uniref:Uncharacterized protein n=1 Tax=Actinorhabdospora filicis TaxID=1785913 RepID=A0A9W6W328_9ACTN|nr:hypothetical protein [Actinorhabdospora filicis]GLZ77662.1 hypothetical protein Afil01_24690 [Actinorhabdospora filicis]
MPGSPSGPPRQKGVLIAVSVFVAVGILCLLFGLIGLIRAAGEKPAEDGSGVQPTPDTPTAPASPPAFAAPPPGVAASGIGEAIPGDGTYLVGADVEAGRYRTTVPATAILCYWERLSNTTGELDDIIANGNAKPGTQAVITIEPDDVAFRSEGCGLWRRT